MGEINIAKKKILKRIGVFVVIVAGIVIGSVYLKYPIKVDVRAVQTYLEDWERRADNREHDVEITSF